MTYDPESRTWTLTRDGHPPVVVDAETCAERVAAILDRPVDDVRFDLWRLSLR